MLRLVVRADPLAREACGWRVGAEHQREKEEKQKQGSQFGGVPAAKRLPGSSDTAGGLAFLLISFCFGFMKSAPIINLV